MEYGEIFGPTLNLSKQNSHSEPIEGSIVRSKSKQPILQLIQDDSQKTYLNFLDYSSIFISGPLIFLILFFVGCQDENSYLYEVNPIELASSTTDKTREKTTDQYISILYANLFQKALAADELIEIRKAIESIGDKEIAHEIVISNFMNRPDVIVPSDDDMRQNLDAFVQATYKRFYVRQPSQAEKAFLKNMIESNPDITAELVYFSFALSDEYQYY